MKYLLVLADGMADYPIEELGGLTPLEYATTPNIDHLASKSRIGLAKTIPDGLPPGSDVANLSVMGYNPDIFYTGRSPIEAVSMGVDLGPEDVAFRCNLVTLSEAAAYEEKVMLDYSAGEISSEEAAGLMAMIARELGGLEREFHAGISYRHLMVWRQAGNIKPILTPPHDISDQVVGPFLPKGDQASLLTDLMRRSYDLLSDAPLNQKRQENGHPPATSIWLWGEGKKPQLPGYEQRYGLKGSVVAAVDLVKGLGICAGLRPVFVPGATGGIRTDFAAKARAAVDELLNGQDFVYLHIESPDECGHKGDANTKVWSIEQIDRLVIAYVISQLDRFDDLRILFTADHPTPCSLKTHSREAVPFLIYDMNRPVHHDIGAFNESEAGKGIYVSQGHLLMDMFIGRE